MPPLKHGLNTGQTGLTWRSFDRRMVPQSRVAVGPMWALDYAVSATVDRVNAEFVEI
jgi:hypothetical protein